MATRNTPAARLAALAEALAGREGVALGSGRRGFGADALQVEAHLAMVSHDRLVLKLPAGRVAELITAGDGVPFDAGKGRAMKEWVAFETLPTSARSLALATEACDFVGGAPAITPAAAAKRAAPGKAAPSKAAPSKPAKAGAGAGATATGDPRALFEELSVGLLVAGTERKRFFGADGLRTGAGFFAFLTKDDRLALKLPPATMRALLAAGEADTAEAVSPSMRKAWVLMTLVDARRWRALAAEARDYVTARPS